MKKALWVSRHATSAAQLSEVAAMGYEIADLEDGLRLGSMNLTDAALRWVRGSASQGS
jgi:hypothetical protein